MIRDFWSIKGKPNLKQEIYAIQSKVDSMIRQHIQMISVYF